MLWRWLRNRGRTGSVGGPSPSSFDYSAWWREAEAASHEPTSEAIDRLGDLVASPTTAPDENERQEEMVEGLRRLLALADQPDVPVVPTQHRVIGTDVCHFVVPAALVTPSAIAGKLFMTSGRLVFAGSSVVTLPWHRVHRLERSDRDLTVTIGGTVNEIVIRCNTYGDALVAQHLTGRLRRASATK